jgi:hypothetical protein
MCKLFLCAAQKKFHPSQHPQQGASPRQIKDQQLHLAFFCAYDVSFLCHFRAVTQGALCAAIGGKPATIGAQQIFRQETAIFS